MRTITNQNPITSFILTTFFISYIVGLIFAILLGIVEKKLGLTDKPFSGVVAKYGPTIAGFITAYSMQGKDGLKKLFLKGIKLNRSFSLTALALIGPPIILIISSDMSGLNKNGDSFSVSWIWIFLQLLLFKLFLGGGFGEEFGWRGFMLSEMTKKYRYLYSTLVIGVVWALWHLPAYFLSNKGQEDPLLPFFIQIIAFSFIFTWFYMKSRESVLIVAILHASFNASMTLIEKVYQVDLLSENYTAYYWIFTGLMVFLALIVFFQIGVADKGMVLTKEETPNGLF